ncbi:MAG: hypothetical protein WDO17_16085 [Alphaproteobacteria bacterium]
MNLIVVGEMTDDLGRRLIDRGEALCELGARLRLHPLNHVGEDVVEERDLLLIELLRRDQEKVRHPPQRIHTLLS